MRAWRAKYPIHAQFYRLKGKARQRGIEFTITLAYFTKFAVQCDYVLATGNGKKSLTVDRIDNLKGYVAGNIQPLTRDENCIKQAKSDQRRYEAGNSWRSRYK